MALNNKPGVSNETRRKIVETAKAMGYDFSKNDLSKSETKTIAFVFFHKAPLLQMGGNYSLIYCA